MAIQYLFRLSIYTEAFLQQLLTQVKPTPKVQDVGWQLSDQPTMSSLQKQFDSEVANSLRVGAQPMYPWTGPKFSAKPRILESKKNWKHRK